MAPEEVGERKSWLPDIRSRRYLKMSTRPGHHLPRGT